MTLFSSLLVQTAETSTSLKTIVPCSQSFTITALQITKTKANLIFELIQNKSLTKLPLQRLRCVVIMQLFVILMLIILSSKFLKEEKEDQDKSVG